MSITEVAIKRPLLITVIFAVLILFGFMSYRSLNYELLPKFEVNVITISTMYAGASAEEVESTVTKKIEEAVSSLEGLDKITATSQEGASTVSLELLSGTDVNQAKQDAQGKVDQIQSQLPDESDKPVINKFSSDDSPVLRMGVFAKLGSTELYDLLDDKIKPQLANVPGVAQINIIGGTEREIKVNVDATKLRAYKLSITEVTQSIRNANQSFPTGKIETRESQFSIQYEAKITDVDALRKVIIKQTAEGSKIYLSDIAEVLDGQEDVVALNRINGTPSIGVQILKQTDANAVEVSEKVRERIGDIEAQYKSNGLTFDIAVDQSVNTLASANAVVEDLMLAILIVALVMLLFLHSVRSSLFILVALPSSMIPTFILMNIFGFSLNLMTLMALSLVVGILVDDSIVVLENITRHLEMGKDRVRAAIDGRSEIGFTALAITLVDVVVFVPMSLSQGIIGNILREFSLVVVFSTLMSLVVSFTITPLLVARFGRLEVLNKNTVWGRLNLSFENAIEKLKEQYGTFLGIALKHKRWVFTGTIVLLAGALSLLFSGFIGAAFISNGDQGEMVVKLELASQSSVYQTNVLAQKVEKILMAKPEIVKVYSNIGYSSTGGITSGTSSNSNMAEISLTLTDKKERLLSADDFGIQLQEELSKIPGLKVTVSPTSITGGTSESAIQIAVKGTDMKDIRKAAALIKEVVKSVPGTQYVQYSTKDPKPEINVKLDRERMTQLGLNANDVGLALQNGFRGNDESKFKVNGNEYSILISLDKYNRTDINSVKQLTFITTSGEVVELSQFATVTEDMGETVLERIDRLSSMKVTSAVVGRPSGSVGDDIKKIMATKKLPEGVSIEYLGDLDRQADAFGSLGTALILAIVLVYLIMVALYESVIYPFVVLFAIPLATIGAFLALALTMENLTIFSIVGMIMLIGLVIKNGILLVDFTNHLKAQGHAVADALMEAGKERLRPILMTTIAMIFGMLPIALATGASAEVKNGMAWVIIGGLTSSLLLTLVVVPSVYMVIENILEFFRKKTAHQNPQKLEAIDNSQ